MKTNILFFYEKEETIFLFFKFSSRYLLFQENRNVRKREDNVLQSSRRY